jgi:hypothetical protein
MLQIADSIASRPIQFGRHGLVDIAHILLARPLIFPDPVIFARAAARHPGAVLQLGVTVQAVSLGAGFQPDSLSSYGISKPPCPQRDSRANHGQGGSAE